MLAHDAQTGLGPGSSSSGGGDEEVQQEAEAAWTWGPSSRGAQAEASVVVDAEGALGYYQRADGRHDLDPIPLEERTWTACTFLSLCVQTLVAACGWKDARVEGSVAD